MHRTTLTIAGIGILLAILLVVNGIAANLFSSVSIDLTEENLYSLSDGTKEILADMEDSVTFRYYYSKTDASNLPAVKLYGTRILNLLREYERYSNGNIVLETYDPRPDSEEAEWAQKYGLKPITAQGGLGLYLGLAIVSAEGDEKSVPLFDLGRQEFLEYDITKLLYSMIQVKRPVIAILSSIDIQGKAAPQVSPQMPPQPAQPWFFVRQLGQFADVRHLETSVADIAADVEVLVVIHPKDLSEETRYAIDQFVLRGGKLMVYSDPYCEADQPTPDPQNPMAGAMGPRNSSLNSLLKTWGVRMVDGQAVGDLQRATRVSTGQGQPVLDFALWLSFRSEDFDKTDVTTAQLENVVMPWAGSLKVEDVEGVTVQPLIRTTDKAKLIAEQDYKFRGGIPQEIIKKFGFGGDEEIVAARITGTFKSNFPNGPPTASSSAEHLSQSKVSSHVTVFSDVDMLSDKYSVSARNFFGQQIYNRLNDNLALFENTAENMTGSDALISIRTRGRHSRPFTKVDEWRQQAQTRWSQELDVANARLGEVDRKLRELQSSQVQAGESQVLPSEMLAEIEKARSEKLRVQKRLREIRRNLRQDIERFGNYLFLANTFLMPLVLVLVSILFVSFRNRSRKTAESS